MQPAVTWRHYERSHIYICSEHIVEPAGISLPLGSLGLATSRTSLVSSDSEGFTKRALCWVNFNHAEPSQSDPHTPTRYDLLQGRLCITSVSWP